MIQELEFLFVALHFPPVLGFLVKFAFRSFPCFPLSLSDACAFEHSPTGRHEHERLANLASAMVTHQTRPRPFFCLCLFLTVLLYCFCFLHFVCRFSALPSADGSLYFSGCFVAFCCFGSFYFCFPHYCLELHSACMWRLSLPPFGGCTSHPVNLLLSLATLAIKTRRRILIQPIRLQTTLF